MYNQKIVFAAACVGMLLFGIVLISLGSILPSLVKQFQLDEISAGSLVTLLPFGILIGSIIFGPVVDRYGYKNILIICSILILLSMEGLAYANSFFILQVSIFLIGFGGGVINGGTNALVSDISSDYKGANLSLLGVFFAIGALGMPAILGSLSKSFSYNQIISTVGFFVTLPIVFFLIIKFPAPKQKQGFPIKQSVSLFKNPTLLLMGFFLAFQSGMEGITNNWTTSYLQNKIEINSEEALYALSLFVTGMAVARFMLGFILKKVTPAIVLYLSLIISIIGSIMLFFMSTYSLMVISLIIMGAGFAAGFPVMLGFVGEKFSSLSGTAFSFVIAIALSGNMLMNYLTGFVSKIFGLKNFILIIIFSAIIMIFLLTTILKKFKLEQINS